MAINIHPWLAKFILWLNPFTTRLKLMCLGYGDDYKMFTELVWEDDKDLDFTDQQSYPKFQLWY